MKRIICLIMVFLFALCALTACKKNGPTIMGNDGATYEQVVDMATLLPIHPATWL